MHYIIKILNVKKKDYNITQIKILIILNNFVHNSKDVSKEEFDINLLHGTFN